MSDIPYVDRVCQPSEGGGVASISRKTVLEALPQLKGWTLKSGEFRIRKSIVFEGFPNLMRFVNAMADLAEEQGHHPDFWVCYNRLDIVLWTHAIGGISQNDLILAAKICALAASKPKW